MRLMELIFKGTVCLVETGIPCQTRLTLRKKSPLSRHTSERRAMLICDNEPESSSVPRYNAKIQTKVFIQWRTDIFTKWCHWPQ